MLVISQHNNTCKTQKNIHVIWELRTEGRTVGRQAIRKAQLSFQMIDDVTRALKSNDFTKRFLKACWSFQIMMRTPCWYNKKVFLFFWPILNSNSILSIYIEKKTGHAYFSESKWNTNRTNTYSHLGFPSLQLLKAFAGGC